MGHTPLPLELPLSPGPALSAGWSPSGDHMTPGVSEVGQSLLPSTHNPGPTTPEAVAESAFSPSALGTAGPGQSSSNGTGRQLERVEGRKPPGGC